MGGGVLRGCVVVTTGCVCVVYLAAELSSQPLARNRSASRRTCIGVNKRKIDRGKSESDR